jgi:hypothetical protein
MTALIAACACAKQLFRDVVVGREPSAKPVWVGDVFLAGPVRPLDAVWEVESDNGEQLAVAV